MAENQQEYRYEILSNDYHLNEKCKSYCLNTVSNGTSANPARLSGKTVTDGAVIALTNHQPYFAPIMEAYSLEQGRLNAAHGARRWSSRYRFGFSEDTTEKIPVNPTYNQASPKRASAWDAAFRPNNTSRLALFFDRDFTFNWNHYNNNFAWVMLTPVLANGLRDRREACKSNPLITIPYASVDIKNQARDIAAGWKNNGRVNEIWPNHDYD